MSLQAEVSKIKTFSCINPRVIMLYFLSVLLISMFLWNPVIHLISLIGGMLFIASLSGLKKLINDLAFFIVIFILITVTNPLFSHNGETPLFFMNSRPVTLEAIIYGMAIGIMIISVMLWCKCLSIIMTSDKFLYVCGGLMPKLSLVFSMALRFIPMFKKQSKNVNRAQKSMGMYSQSSRTDKIKSTMNTMSILTGWSLENAVETGNAMRAKGYGLKPRTNYSIFRFDTIDLIITVSIFIFTAVTLTCTALGELDFYYYPYISKINMSALSIAAYISYTLLSLLPFIIETEENIKWKYYISKI